MKKLLGFLSSLVITGGLTSTLISCNKRIDNSGVQYNKGDIKKLLAKILGDDSDNLGIDYGDIISNSDISSILVNMINQATSTQYSYEANDYNLKQLGLSTYKFSDYNSKWNSNIDTIISDKLFSEYTNSVSSNEPLDYTTIKKLFSLNIDNSFVKNNVQIKAGDKKDISEDLKNNKNAVIYFGSDEASSKRWQIFHENGDESIKETIVPTLQQLTSSGTKFFLKTADGKTTIANLADAKEALKFRFYDYYTNSLKKDIWETALSLSYGESNMYNIRKAGDDPKYHPYLNVASSLFNNSQSWKVSSTDKLTTNVKLVWTFKYKATTESDNSINAVLSGLDGTIDYKNQSGELAKDKSIKDVIDAFSSSTVKYYDDSKSKFDPYFKKQYYSGMAVYNGSTAIGTSPIAGEAFETNVENYNGRGGIVKDNAYNWYLTDAKDSTLHEVVMVLPVYMIQLLGGDNNAKTPYSIEGSNKTDKEVVNLGPNPSNKDLYKNLWNNSVNSKLHSKDIADVVNNYDSEKNKTRDELISDIQYSIAQDTTNLDVAKTIIYTKYIDIEDIYYSPLYDAISKYIENQENDK